MEGEDSKTLYSKNLEKLDEVPLEVENVVNGDEPVSKENDNSSGPQKRKLTMKVIKRSVTSFFTPSQKQKPKKSEKQEKLDSVVENESEPQKATESLKEANPEEPVEEKPSEDNLEKAPIPAAEIIADETDKVVEKKIEELAAEAPKILTVVTGPDDNETPKEEIEGQTKVPNLEEPLDSETVGKLLNDAINQEASDDLKNSGEDIERVSRESFEKLEDLPQPPDNKELSEEAKESSSDEFFKVSQDDENN